MSPTVPARTTYSGPPLSGPGIIYTTSKLIKPNGLSLETYNWWYENVHIPDMIESGVVKSALRFKNLNLGSDTPYLAIYIVPDMGALQGSGLKNVKQTHECLPDNGPIYRFVNFDTRFYQLTQDFGTKGSSQDWYPALVSGAVEPAFDGHEDLDRWYREEHNHQATKQPGWKRTTRYKLVFQVRNVEEPQNSEGAPAWLALHQWEDGYLPSETQPFDPISEWTIKVMKSARKIESGNYQKIGSYGKF